MDELQIFNNAEFGEIRTVDVDGKIWFIASDIAKALGYTNPSKALKDHCRYITKRSIPHPQGKGTLEVNTIPEGDLYRLVAKSELPSAERFETWVFDEVLPTIRQTGQYTIKQSPTDTPSAQRAKASLLNATTRQAKLLYEIAASSSNALYRQAGEAVAMNMLAGRKVVDMPMAEQRPNHELSYFCKFIGKNENWRSVLGKKLKAAGYKQVPENGVMKVSMDKGHNQRDTFYWYDDVLLPILEKMFPEEYNGGA